MTIASAALQKRLRATPVRQMESDIPAIRIPEAGVRTFQKIIVDAAGPYLVRKGRGRAREKRYLIIFSCLSFRGVHTETAYGKVLERQHRQKQLLPVDELNEVCAKIQEIIERAEAINVECDGLAVEAKSTIAKGYLSQRSLLLVHSREVFPIGERLANINAKGGTRSQVQGGADLQAEVVDLEGGDDVAEDHQGEDARSLHSSVTEQSLDTGSMAGNSKNKSHSEKRRRKRQRRNDRTSGVGQGGPEYPDMNTTSSSTSPVSMNAARLADLQRKRDEALQRAQDEANANIPAPPIAPNAGPSAPAAPNAGPNAPDAPNAGKNASVTPNSSNTNRNVPVTPNANVMLLLRHEGLE